MVMPAVLPHSEQFKYMAMARAECGAGGNLHYHGFSVGLPGQVVARVRADVDGEGDMLPPSVASDVAAVLPSLPWSRSCAPLPAGLASVRRGPAGEGSAA